VALRNDAAEALAWYRRVLATERTKMRVVAEVYGLWLQERHKFSNGVMLLPVSELPDSPNSLALKQLMPLRPGILFPAAVIFELDDVRDEHHEVGHARFVEILEKMRKTVTAFVLAGNAAPTMSAGWQEFVDPELQAAEFGRSWMVSVHEGRLPNHPTNVTEEMFGWVEKYLQLPPEVANACDVPIARLNLARRRIAPGDKAIDGSVCLEALLSGRSRGELTHKLSVRAALLLGRSLEERQKIAEKVRKFYALRSDVVHGSVGKKETANREIAEEGLLLCLAALRNVVTSARPPEPELWELTGGPAWNRYAEPECK
jgi:Apea-like HEPN